MRIWRDLNQSGISQANEIQTLKEAGTVSIDLNSKAASTDYCDATLVQSATFTRTDGSTGQAGSFILSQNNFEREFATIAISDEAQGLPDLKGCGRVRNLQKAATLSQRGVF
jgi:hypothetical protein